MLNWTQATGAIYVDWRGDTLNGFIIQRARARRKVSSLNAIASAIAIAASHFV